MTLQECAVSMTSKAKQCPNEEAAKQFLIIPFLQYLGYDIFDPHEVRPEHHADFAEKNKNRVDYAIFIDDAPRIGLEAKAVGAALEDHRGQLRGYFNALPSVKMGILTDGVRYECYADTDEPNIMDGTPFLTFDLSEIAENGVVEGSIADGVSGLRKENFDPDKLGATARRKLLQNGFIDLLRVWSKEPSDDLVRTMLTGVEYQNRQTRKVLDDAHPIAKDAFKIFIEEELYRRIRAASSVVDADDSVDTAEVVESEPLSDGIITTEGEIAAYDYAKKRLAYLVDTEDLFNEIEHIVYKDMRTTFKVYYKRINAGSLFNYTERESGEMTFIFPSLPNREIITKSLADIDEALLEAFKKRVLG